MISRFKPAAWIVAVADDAAVGQGLAFSYGVHPFPLAETPEDWCEFARGWMRQSELPGLIAMLVAGPSPRNPEANHRLEFLRIGERKAASET
jgi:pyruvate kinase